MGKEYDLIDNIFFVCLFDCWLFFSFYKCYRQFNLEMILRTSMKESSSSRTLSSLFLILSLNDFFGSSLRELGISFHSLAPILERAFFLYFKS